MVVGRGHRHDLLDTELGEPSGIDRGQAWRVADGTGGDDRALAGHQAGHARHGADAAGICERDVRALVGVGLKGVVARAHHQLVVARHEVGEAELARVAQDGHHERARAVLALHVNREPEAHAARGHALRLPVLLGVGVAHHGHVAGGLHDRPGDQVRERQLLAGGLQLLATAVERGHGHGAEARGRRDRAALVHELHERGRGAADRLDLGAGGRGGGGAAIPLDCGEHVLLRHPAARTGSRDRLDVDAVSACDARGHGGRVPAVGDGCACGRLRLGGFGARLDRAVRRAGIGAGARSNATQHRADRHSLVGLDEDLLDRARHWGGHLGIDLVGGDLDQRVVDGDGVARLHPPFEDGALGHRIAHLRERDVDNLAAACGRLIAACGRLVGRRRGGSVAVGVYLAEHASHLNRLIGFRGDVYKRSGHRRRNLGIDLVGGDLDQRLVSLDPVTDLLQPTQDRAFGNRLPHLGHGDLNARGACGHPSPQL